MEIRQLEYFLAVVREGSFTRAARKLHVSQPALSQGIQQLETRLGARLFDRGRTPALTLAGSRLAAPATRILELVAEAQEAVREEPGALAGPIRLAVLTSAITHVLPGALGRFGAAHPGVQFELSKPDPETIEALVLQGAVHLGVTPRRPSTPSLEVEELGRWDWVLAASRRFGRRRLGTLLQEHPLVLAAPWQEDQLRDHTDLLDGPTPPRIQHATNCVVVARQLVAEGMGPGMLPAYALGDDLRVLQRFPDLTISLYLIRRKHRPGSRAAEAFARFLLEEDGAVQADAS